MKYKVVEGNYSSPNQFEQEVNAYLSSGYKLYGNLVVYTYEGSGMYCQAMILEEKEES